MRTTRLLWPTVATVLAVLVGTPSAAAQTAPLYGQVVDSAGHPVKYAFVRVREHDLGTLADSSGLFRFDEVPVGHHLLQSEGIGFRSDSVSVSVEPGGSMVILTLVSEPILWEVDETPRPFQGDLRIGLRDRPWVGRERAQVELVLQTEYVFNNTGNVIDVAKWETGGFKTIQILGVHYPSLIALPATAPANVSLPLDLHGGDPPDTLVIRYRDDVDRYLVWKTQDHAFIEPIEASFTSSPRDSVELFNPGSVRIRCMPAGFPPEDCERFISGLRPLGARSESLRATPEAAAIRFIGNTLYTAKPDGRERWLIAHGVVEADIERVLTAAKAFTAARGGRAMVYVSLHLWDGRDIRCWEGSCEPVG